MKEAIHSGGFLGEESGELEDRSGEVWRDVKDDAGERVGASAWDDPGDRVGAEFAGCVLRSSRTHSL